MKKPLEKMIEERDQRKLEIRKIVKEIQQEEEIKRHHQREKEKFLLAVSTVMDKWNHQAKDEGLLNCYVYLLVQSLHVRLRWLFVEGGVLRVSSLKEMVVSVVRILKHTLQHHSFPFPPFVVFFPGGGGTS